MYSADLQTEEGCAGVVHPPDLRSDPLYVKVYTLLKDWIIEGRLQPGERIKETVLASDLNVSRTPVRDALRRLEQDRLIVAVQGSCYEVYEPTAKDLADLYEVRATLEGGAARLAAGRPPTEVRASVEAMAAVLEEMRAAYGQQPPQVLVNLDTRFHEILVAASGNPVLVELHSHLSTRLRHVRSMSGDLTVRQQQVLEQHASIIETLVRSDASAAESATRSHILSVYIAAQQAFVERQSAPLPL